MERTQKQQQAISHAKYCISVDREMLAVYGKVKLTKDQAKEYLNTILTDLENEIDYYTELFNKYLMENK